MANIVRVCNEHSPLTPLLPIEHHQRHGNATRFGFSPITINQLLAQGNTPTVLKTKRTHLTASPAPSTLLGTTPDTASPANQGPTAAAWSSAAGGGLGGGAIRKRYSVPNNSPMPPSGDATVVALPPPPPPPPPPTATEKAKLSLRPAHTEPDENNNNTIHPDRPQPIAKRQRSEAEATAARSAGGALATSLSPAASAIAASTNTPRSSHTLHAKQAEVAAAADAADDADAEPTASSISAAATPDATAAPAPGAPVPPGLDCTLVANILEDNQLGHLSAIFRREEIDLDVFCMMNRADLGQIGVSDGGDVERVLHIIRTLNKL